MSFYSDKVDLVERMLALYGQSVTLSKVAHTFNAGTGDASSTPTNTPVNLATFSYKLKDIDGTNVMIGDQHGFMSAASGVVPAQGDLVIIGGVTWKVIDAEPLAPGGVAVFYDCQLRKG